MNLKQKLNHYERAANQAKQDYDKACKKKDWNAALQHNEDWKAFRTMADDIQKQINEQ